MDYISMREISIAPARLTRFLCFYLTLNDFYTFYKDMWAVTHVYIPPTDAKAVTKLLIFDSWYLVSSSSNMLWNDLCYSNLLKTLTPLSEI